MHPTQHAALDMPEIITRVGSFLQRKSLVACLTVSSSFHANLAPFIYRKLSIYPNRRPPSPQTLIRYAHLIHDLGVYAFMSLAYLTAGYKNLRSISIKTFRGNASRQVGTDDEILDALLKLMQNNPGLKAWILKDPWPQLPVFIWKAIAETPTELDDLSVCHTTVDEASRPWFLRACQKARHLELSKMNVLRSGSSTTYLGDVNTISRAPQLNMLQSSPRMFSPHKVRFNSVQGISMLEQLEFLSRCTGLQCFYWNTSEENLVTVTTTGQQLVPQQGDFRRFFQSTTWPRLTSIVIESSSSTLAVNGAAQLVTDECFRYMLDSIPSGKLEELICKGSRFGALGMMSLTTQHFSSLSVLDGSGCAGVTSSMVQRLLEVCSQLTKIDVSELHVRDLRKGRPWVCTGLTSLYVQFNLRLEEGDIGWRDFACSPPADKSQDAMETTRFIQDQQHVFRRLAELTSLESLDVQKLQVGFNGVTGSDGSILHNGLLDFRISHGLEMLSTLKKLRYLDVSNTLQQLGRKDVEIMTAQWPMLSMLRGALNIDKEVNGALDTFSNLLKEKVDDALSTIVLNNPGLKRFTLDIFGANLTIKLWKMFFQACGGLNENGAFIDEAPGLATGPKLRYMNYLRFSRLTIDHESYPWFVRVCALTHGLNLERIEFTTDPENDASVDIGQLLPPAPLPCVVVEFISLFGLPLCDQMEFLSRCTNVREIRLLCFKWHVDSVDDDRYRMESTTLESVVGEEVLTAEDKSIQDHRLAFERLSALTLLEELKLPRRMAADEEVIVDGLEVRLAFGLERLKTLRRLKV
ncbi:hypothetical protein EC991_000960 [Linnemannia zychae]|nr:hypothetical protein EC991_000960 [Linnemannia zychae]